MTFSKSFAHQPENTPYTRWIEITLKDHEEQQAEEQAKKENKKIMQDCIKDAIELSKQTSLKDYQSDIISIATALFEKRASHAVFHKEAACKKKFDEWLKTLNN
tara:strand:+ start:612 stop:923 length:312 start_codon:yes stop_codon:yes gene_type:complete